MGKRDILKKIAVSIITLSGLTAVLMFLFRDNLRDIALAFRALSVPDILWLFVLGASYQLRKMAPLCGSGPSWLPDCKLSDLLWDHPCPAAPLRMEQGP